MDSNIAYHANVCQSEICAPRLLLGGRVHRLGIMEKRDNDIGWAVRCVRNAQGKSLEDVAAVVDIEASNLSRFERGTQEIKLSNLHAVAECLGVSVADLYVLANSSTDKDSVRLSTLLSIYTELTTDQVEQFVSYGKFLKKNAA